MLLTRRQPDKPAAAANNLCSIRTLNGLYTEFGIDPNSALMLVCARLRHVAGTQWDNKKYMNMKHLEAAYCDSSIA